LICWVELDSGSIEDVFHETDCTRLIEVLLTTFSGAGVDVHYDSLYPELEDRTVKDA